MPTIADVLLCLAGIAAIVVASRTMRKVLERRGLRAGLVTLGAAATASVVMAIWLRVVLWWAVRFGM